MIIKLKKTRDDALLPTYGHPGDVGMDVYAHEDVVINPGEHARIYNGFAMEFPHGYAAIVKDKSSISKAGLHTMGGVFDAGYRGEYNVHLVNLSDKPYRVEKGDKVAQILIIPTEQAEFEVVEELSSSERGEGAFGSTGRK